MNYGVETDFNKDRPFEGEWERVRRLPDGDYRHICSVCACLYKNADPIGYPYCPWCGAKMNLESGTDIRVRRAWLEEDKEKVIRSIDYV